MIKFYKLLLIFFCAGLLSACVTQQYGNENTLITDNHVNKDELAMTRISLGLGYLNMGNTTQAKFNLEKAKRFSPKLVQVHTAFAHYYETVGEYDLAITSYEQALSINALDADTLNNYGVFLCRQGQLDKAEQQFLKAIAIPSYLLVSESYKNLALCQIEKEHFVKGEEYLAKAIMHNPANGPVLLEMSRLQYAKKDYPQALIFIKRYEKSTRRFTPNALALAYKINILLGDKKAAQNYANLLIKMFPSSYEAKQYILNELAEIEADKLAEAYQRSTAGNDKKRVVVLSPKNPTVALASKNKTANQSNNSNAPASGQANSQVKKEINAVAPKPVSNTTADLNEQKITEKTNQQTTMTLPIHVVKAGDSLFNISVKYNIHMSKLLLWNKISKNKILHIGDVIYLAEPRKVTP